MAIKLVDELKAMGNFPIAHAEGINLVKTDGTEDNLQNLFDNGELGGGGGDSSVTLTQEEYEALSEEQKLDGLYYTYDTKRIYKNGVQYGASDAEDIGYNNAESGIQATTVQGAIDNVVEKVDGLISDTTSSTTSTWSSKKTSDEIAEVDTKISNNLGELGNLATTEKTNLVGAVNEVANGVGVAKTNPSDKDLNNYKTNGRYTFGSWKQYANAPFETTNGTMLVEDTGAYKTQIAIHRTTGAVKTRLFADNAWSDWRELATMDNEENVLTSISWDTLNTKGRYYFSGGVPMTNSPEAVPFGLLEVITVGSYCIVQRYFAFNGKLYIRRWTGAWQDWYRFDGTTI